MKKKTKQRKENHSNAGTVMGYTDLANKILGAAKEDLTQTLKSLHREFLHLDRKVEIKRLIVSKNKKNTDVINDSGVSKDYFYSVYQGKRNPSRNKTIQLCFGIGLNRGEANAFIKHMGHNELYLRDERDAIIFAALTQGISLFETDDLLDEHGYKTISKE
jgi:hypothetical protein